MYLRKSRNRKSRKSCRSFNSPSLDYAQKNFAKDYSRLETIDGLVDASDGQFFSKCAFPGFCHDEDHIQIFDNHQVRKRKITLLIFFVQYLSSTQTPSVQHKKKCQINTRSL